MQKLAFRRTCPTDRAFDGLCFDQHGAFVVQNSSHGRSAPLPSPPRTVTDGVAVSARDQVDHLVQQGGLQHDGQQPWSQGPWAEGPDERQVKQNPARVFEHVVSLATWVKVGLGMTWNGPGAGKL